MDGIHRSLNRRKRVFLDGIEEDVRSYIVSTGRQCIAIVEKTPEQNIYRTWNVRMDDDLRHFCVVLYKFTRKQQYKGHDLDSALTEPIGERVATAYRRFYEQESRVIADGMLKMLAADGMKLQKFMDRLVDIVLQSSSSKVKKQVVHLVTHQVKASVEQASTNGIRNHNGHLAVTTAGSQVTAIVTNLLVGLLATNITKIVTRTLASTFMKRVLTVLIKRFVLAAVTTVVVRFLAAHVGAAIGSSTVTWIIMPLLVAYIGYQITTFPETLGDKVSRRIRSELSDRFVVTNQCVLEKVYEAVFSGNELVDAIAKDGNLQRNLRDLSVRLQGDRQKLRGQNQLLVTTLDVELEDAKIPCPKCHHLFVNTAAQQTHERVWHG